MLPRSETGHLEETDSFTIKATPSVIKLFSQMHRTHPHTLLPPDQNHFDAVLLAWMLRREPKLCVEFGFADGKMYNSEDPALPSPSRHLAIDLSNSTGHSSFVVSSYEMRDLGKPVGHIGYQGAVEFRVYCYFT